MKKLYTNRLNLRLALVLFLMCFFPLSTLSNSNFNTGQSSVTLLTESNQIGSEETLLVGLEFKLSPGWHTYWENPGDSGEGASIKWNLPSGFKASTILWPGPKRIPVEPLMTYGYEDKALLLTEIKSPKEFSNPVKISAKINWLTCKDICIPQEGQVDMTLIKGPKVANQFTSKLKEIASTVPKNFPSPYRVSVINEKIFLQFEKEGSRRV